MGHVQHTSLHVKRACWKCSVACRTQFSNLPTHDEARLRLVHENGTSDFIRFSSSRSVMEFCEFFQFEMLQERFLEAKCSSQRVEIYC